MLDRKEGDFSDHCMVCWGIRKWKTPTHICDARASSLLWSGEHSNFECLTREHQLKGVTEACQWKGGSDQRRSRQMSCGKHLEREAHVIRRIMEHPSERELVIMQRLGIQTHTGAAWTATIKDGLAAFAHHGHRRFP